MTQTLPPKLDGTTGPSRRTFLKWSGVAAGVAGLAATTSHLPTPAVAAQTDGMEGVDKTVWNACLANCQSRCPLRLQVKDGAVVRVLADNTGSDEFGDFQIRACVRGRNQRERIYSPDRIKKPMKRVGQRGEGKWEEITWEEAFDTIASELKRVKETYGNEALWYHYGSGSTGGNITKRGTWPRLLNTYGGYLGQYGDYSTAQLTAGTLFHYGGWIPSNSLEDVKNSKLQVMFANNPLETRMSGGGELAVVQKTKSEYGIRTIIIDPRYSETALAVGDEWVPIKPGTDAALVAGMIHVILSENLQDQDFLDKYCVGFDEDHMPEGIPPHNSYRSYIEGKGADGIEKTPEWAQDITGVPATTIRRLAREIANAKPCAITQGWGLQRHANGENGARGLHPRRRDRQHRHPGRRQRRPRGQHHFTRQGIPALRRRKAAREHADLLLQLARRHHGRTVDDGRKGRRARQEEAGRGHQAHGGQRLQHPHQPAQRHPLHPRGVAG